MMEGESDEKPLEGAVEPVVHLCCTPGCGKPASMACPTCLKLGLPPSRFCGQECFKNNWNEHKLIHPKKEDPSKLPPIFRGYTFTGPLRPFQQSPRRIVPPEIPRPDYAEHPTGFPFSESEDKRTGSVMKIYTKAEIDGIRAACRIGREVLDLAGDAGTSSSYSCTLSYNLSYILSCSLTLTLTLSYTQSLIHIHIHSLSQSQTFSLTLPYSLTHNLPISHPITHSHMLSVVSAVCCLLFVVCSTCGCHLR